MSFSVGGKHMTPETRDRLLAELTKKLADDGKLVEVGWISLMRAAIPINAPPIQIREMRLAFMAGAQHLWASINSLLLESAGDDATPADVRRMELIDRELRAFADEMKNDVRFGQGFEAGPPQ